MITYSTNWMGPISMDWYRERGLTERVEYTTDTIEEITTYYSAGRIDIYGVPDEPYPIEYSLPPMRVTDWEDLSEWLDDLETEELLSFDKLIAQFEQTVGKKIQWWKDDENL